MFFALLDLLRQTGELPAQLHMQEGPEITLVDQGESLLFHAKLDGVDPRTVQVHLAESQLAIGGTRTVEERTVGERFCSVQSSSSSFCRVLPMPVPVEPRQAASQWLLDGSLVITLPKASRRDPF